MGRADFVCPRFGQAMRGARRAASANPVPRRRPRGVCRRRACVQEIRARMDARRLSGFGRALVGGALGVLAASCGGPTAMSGFSDREARATVVPEPAERCAIQSGRLVIETESVLIREYPHHRSERSRLEQPLIVTVLSRPGTRDAAAEVTAFAAPAAYAAGDRIDRLKGEVLLRRSLRSLVGRHLVIRLAENDRTASPSWVRHGKEAAQAGGAATLVGLPSPTAS